jgi:5-methylcytosine-specific restriction endonuclease McrA
MSAEVMKRCQGECGGEYPLIFFRRKTWHAKSTIYHSKCIACLQAANDKKKRPDRWPDKARDTIRRHAEKYDMSLDGFIEKYGWDIPRVAHLMKHASENTCSYCRDLYSEMGHGLADITMDIIDPRKEPYLETNAQPCCRTCNTRKGDRTPEEWAIILRCWRQYDRRMQKEALTRLPLWEAAE